MPTHRRRRRTPPSRSGGPERRPRPRKPTRRPRRRLRRRRGPVVGRNQRLTRSMPSQTAVAPSPLTPETPGTYRSMRSRCRVSSGPRSVSVPSGHRTTTRSTRSTSPRPKWTSGGNATPKLVPPATTVRVQVWSPWVTSTSAPTAWRFKRAWLFELELKPGPFATSSQL